MYEPDEKIPTDMDYGETQSPEGFEGETDRVNGEYHYKNGYTQKIYSDAHYAPVDDTTAPPRYYTPPEKPVKEKKPVPVRENCAQGSAVRVVCMCLVCALVGGAGGAVISERHLSGRISQLEQTALEQSQLLEQMTAEQTEESSAAAQNLLLPDKLSPAVIYDEACSQVVGITTEVTYTNFFGQTSSSAVSGSGFIVSEDGYILTNYHVIEYASQYDYTITVMTHDGTRYDAAIVGVEEGNDLAVLKIDASGLTSATFGNSSELSVGDEVYAVGNPLGELEFTMTTGHVSALDRLITTGANTGAINMFQIDAAVNSGNSGGPVYDSRGNVVGVVTAKYSSTGVEGLGFAIPINDASAIADDIIRNGYVTGKARLGIEYDDRYTAIYSRYWGTPLGTLVRTVKTGSCAEKAGILQSDIITRLGDTVIEGYSDLAKALRQYSAGDTAEIEIYRTDRVSGTGQTLVFSVTFDEDVPDSKLGGATVTAHAMA